MFGKHPLYVQELVKLKTYRQSLLICTYKRFTISTSINIVWLGQWSTPASVFIGQKMQLTGWANWMLITCVMRHARTHKLQLSSPTVHSYTVIQTYLCNSLESKTSWVIWRLSVYFPKMLRPNCARQHVDINADMFIRHNQHHTGHTWNDKQRIAE